MRAEKTVRTSQIHISGAEGLYRKPDIDMIVNEYVFRALNHPKGIPDNIIITIQRLSEKPSLIRALPVVTLKCSSHSEAGKHIRKILKLLGTSNTAVRTAERILYKNRTMRGASLVTSETGERVEPDRKRGIRASRLGISGTADKVLSLKLRRHGINSSTVKEALVLASKVASCSDILAEVCISDDPDYTTGYIASAKYGYIRIPHIKKKGALNGGRVFFLKPDADPASAVRYLEKKPVIISKISECRGESSLDEVLNHNHR